MKSQGARARLATQNWWSWTGSNRRPPACKAGARPTELQPRPESLVGLGRLELPTSRLSSARSNQLSYRPGKPGLPAHRTDDRRDAPAAARDLLSKSIANGKPFMIFLRKEVIQPQVPLRLPCYDFTPVADLTVDGCLLAVSAPASGKTNSHGVTGGVYKARERIHRGMLIRDY